jgi:mono/diheme cytochrome c family protein
MSVKRRVLFAATSLLLLLLALGSQAWAQDGDAENGKALFGQYCAGCHGFDGQGRVGATLSDWFVSISPEAFVRATVSDGVAGTMPAFARSKGGPLTDQEIDDIAVYILSWRERVEPAPTPTPIPITPIPKVAGITGDPTAGAQVFARECQLCHGDRGQGGIGASLSGPIPAVQPAAFLRQTINNGVEGSPMPAFDGILSGDEVENVVAFILSWNHQPISQATPAAEDEGGFNWLVALVFLIGALFVGTWLVIHYSQRKAPQ